MGIETALVGLGMSAGTASTVAGVITAVGTAAASAEVAKALQPKQQAQTVAPVTEADKPPQAEKAPDTADIARKNALAASATGALAGNSSTLLTGSAGVSPGSLNLGGSTLLGQ
jgi:hypothetical protein